MSVAELRSYKAILIRPVHHLRWPESLTRSLPTFPLRWVRLRWSAVTVRLLLPLGWRRPGSIRRVPRPGCIVRVSPACQGLGMWLWPTMAVHVCLAMAGRLGLGRSMHGCTQETAQKLCGS